MSGLKKRKMDDVIDLTAEEVDSMASTEQDSEDTDTDEEPESSASDRQARENAVIIARTWRKSRPLARDLTRAPQCESVNAMNAIINKYGVQDYINTMLFDWVYDGCESVILTDTQFRDNWSVEVPSVGGRVHDMNANFFGTDPYDLMPAYRKMKDGIIKDEAHTAKITRLSPNVIRVDRVHTEDEEEEEETYCN